MTHADAMNLVDEIARYSFRLYRSASAWPVQGERGVYEVIAINRRTNTDEHFLSAEEFRAVAKQERRVTV